MSNECPFQHVCVCVCVLWLCVCERERERQALGRCDHRPRPTGNEFWPAASRINPAMIMAFQVGSGESNNHRGIPSL